MCMDQLESKNPAIPNSSSGLDCTPQGSDSFDNPISFSDCQDLARSVKACSRSLIEGTWVDITHSRGRKKRFIPGSFEAAKEFLRASVEGISSRGPSHLETPVLTLEGPV